MDLKKVQEMMIWNHFISFSEYAEWKAGKRPIPASTSGHSSHKTVNGSDSIGEKHLNLEETGKQIGNMIADDDPENEMEVDPAEEVTVSEVNLAIKDDDEDDETDELEPEKWFVNFV